MSTRQDRQGVLVLTREECGLIAHAAPEILAKFRRDGINNPTLRALLVELHAVAVGTPIEAGSVAGIRPTKLDSIAQGQDWCSTKKAADRLEISQRRVVALLQEGRIVGQQRSTRSAWKVSEQSVKQYLASREAS